MSEFLNAPIWSQILRSLTFIGAIGILGGILIAVLGRGANTGVKLFGQELSTTDVGVAIAFLGTVLFITTIRRLFRSLDQVTSSVQSESNRYQPSSTREDAVGMPEIKDLDALLKIIGELSKKQRVILRELLMADERIDGSIYQTFFQAGRRIGVEERGIYVSGLIERTGLERSEIIYRCKDLATKGLIHIQPLTDIQYRAVQELVDYTNKHYSSVLSQLYTQNEIQEEREKYAREALHDAIRTRDFNKVRKLITAGADVNAKYSEVFFVRSGGNRGESMDLGSAPLHIAAAYGYKEIVQLLIDLGADINALDSRDRTPLHWAAHQGDPIILELLLNHGAIIDAQDDDGETPLHWAAVNGEIVSLLVKAGADINAKNKNGFTPLRNAIMFGEDSVGQELVREGADINDKSGESYTDSPLHFAANSGVLWMVKLLSEKGADINSLDKNGKTPLDLAQRNESAGNKYKETAEFLKSIGAKKSAGS